MAAPAPSDDSDSDTSRAFCASYPVPATAKAITRALCRRGLIRSSPGHPACILQWVPISKVVWEPVLEGQQLCAAYFAHHGLVNKQALYHRLRAYMNDPDADPVAAACLRACMLPCFDTGFRITDAAGVVAEAEAAGGVWALKAVATNNALGVYFSTAADLRATIATAAAEMAAAGDDRSTLGAWVLQKYVDAPLLFRGRKFHARVNVLAAGSLAVLVHRDVVAHVASEPFVCGDWGNKWVHVTNHGVQRGHPSYSRPTHTLLLPALAHELVGVTFEALMARICDAVAAVFRAMEGQPKLFLPMRNCFELFGFDFMFTSSGQPVLLEVNGGPALEGVAMPELCDEIVNDVLQVVLDRRDGAPVACPHFQRVVPASCSHGANAVCGVCCPVAHPLPSDPS